MKTLLFPDDSGSDLERLSKISNFLGGVRVFIPDSAGCQAETFLTSLKLKTKLLCLVEDFMRELSGMLESNTTLKHVEVSFSHNAWEVRSFKPSPNEKVCTQDMLEVMMRNVLKVNISLQSLVVGSWKLLRVGGDQWQMSYRGPCLARKLPNEEYDVKVKMHL
ncbi:hypothetical protein M758_10G139500 [Ceratodon purpureus]|nr:hypothetical protein M758_10G139500 [Ceratodon purpureus]